MAISIIINMAGSIALLLWGLHMVQVGARRALGGRLRVVLRAALASRPRAFGAGMLITAILQSSTATSLMTAGFLEAGHVELAPALAVILGANVGSSVLVQALLLPVSALAPLALIVGFLAFQRCTGVAHDVGRAVIGLGLMLLALHLLGTGAEPLAESGIVRPLFGQLSSQPALALLIGMILAWVAHSSVAIVLLDMQLVGLSILSPVAGLAIMLGANLGSALNPLFEGAARTKSEVRRLPAAAFIARLVGVALAFTIVTQLDAASVPLHRARDMIAFAHIGLNVMTAAIALPALSLLVRFVERLIPAGPQNEISPRYLVAVDSPAHALGTTAREALRLADGLERMLSSLNDVLISGDRAAIAAAQKIDDVLDALDGAIKRHIAGIDRSNLTGSEHDRLDTILGFVTHLEQAGDLVDKRLLALARKRFKRGLPYSQDDLLEAQTLLDRVRHNLSVSATLFIDGDIHQARALASEIDIFREIEAAIVKRHFHALSDNVDILAARALHLDIVRDMGRVNAHIIEATAYPILERQGDLLETRLSFA